ncbi:MAG: hypothetical protein GX790_04745 [Syntrophomonadaceae bacterium]|nr:hypothetical protein [Syntrophomonadaceae bacterium]
MGFVLVRFNEVVMTELPKTGVLKDGSTVSGYHLLDEDTLREEGWLPLEDNPPEYNPETQYLIDDGYEIFEDKVVKKYRIEDIPEPELPQPNVTELIAEYLIDVDFRLSLIEIGLI